MRREEDEKRTFILLGINGALLFGGEEQSEQVVQQSVSQQNEVGRQKTAKIILSTWRHKETIKSAIHIHLPKWVINEIYKYLKLFSKYILFYLSACCHTTNNATAFNQSLPPSIFSSLLISMMTNFSHTANVGRVEEMNWPNLSVEERKLKFLFIFLLFSYHPHS